MHKFTAYTLLDAPAGSKAKLEEVKQAWGFVPQLHGVLAESPITLEAYDTLFGLVAKSSFTPAEQQVVYLAVNVIHECEYCTAGHTFLARKAALPEAAIEALREQRPIADARLQTLRSFAEDVVHQRGRVGEAVVQAFLAAGFTKEQVLEVITIIATKTISNYVNHIADTPKESFMADPALEWIAPSKRSSAG